MYSVHIDTVVLSAYSLKTTLYCCFNASAVDESTVETWFCGPAIVRPLACICCEAIYLYLVEGFQ